MLSYYNPFYDVDGHIVSCDNIRLKFDFGSEDSLKEFSKFLLKFSDKYQYYSSFRDCSYRHLFVFGVHGLSFSLGLSFNGFHSDDQLKGFLDVNPNKILGDLYFQDGYFRTMDCPFLEDDSFQFYLKYELKDILSSVVLRIRECAVHSLVSRFDLALDVPVVRSRVQLIKDNRKYSQIFKSSENFTEYLGNTNEGGRVKVYNKSLESDLPYDLTRIEVTCDTYDYDKFCKRWPRVYVREKIPLDSENVLIQLLSEQDVDRFDFYLRQIGRKQKERVRDLLLTRPFEISKKAYDHVVNICEDFEN